MAKCKLYQKNLIQQFWDGGEFKQPGNKVYLTVLVKKKKQYETTSKNEDSE